MNERPIRVAEKPEQISFLRIVDDVHRAGSTWLETKVLNDGVRSTFLPAGRTPEGLYRFWEAEKPEWLRSVRLKQIDDVISGPQAGCFRRFFETELPSFQPQIDWLDRADSSADVAILGLGLNGHIAFHEPHLPENFYGGCVALSEITCRTLGLSQPTWGLTYGAAEFLKCKSILMMATGESKASVVAQLCSPLSRLPAKGLVGHRDFTLLIDAAAARDLESDVEQLK